MPEFWAMVINLPGVLAGDWIAERFRSSFATYACLFLVNWLFWFGILKLFFFLKRKFSHPAAPHRQ